MNAPVAYLSRDEWLAQVGEKTGEHREARAQSLERRAYDLRREHVDRVVARHAYAAASMGLGAEDLSPAEVRETAWREVEEQEVGKWQFQRAAGQRGRIDSVTACAKDGVMQVGCSGCGEQRHFMRTCGSGLLCSQCRTRRNRRTRERFRRSRGVALRRVRQRGLLVGFSRWSEKLLTFTVPHRQGSIPLSPERRVELLRAAWKRMLRDLNRLVFTPASRARGVEVHWYAAQEWTPGEDGLGHPHVHVWVLCPWLDRAWLVERWTAAIAAEGHVWEEGETAILDVRAAKGRNGKTDDSVADELIKYLTKDLEETKSEHGRNRLVDPDVYARMYQLYDGARRCQGSKGFVALAEENVAPSSCCSCGACGFDVKFVRSDDPSYDDALAGVAFTRSSNEERRGRLKIPIVAA